jgi:hypothetical protein
MIAVILIAIAVALSPFVIWLAAEHNKRKF